MRTADPESDREVIWAPTRVRLMGAWMLVIVGIGSIAFGASAILNGAWGALAFLVLWSLPLGYYGYRVTQIAVVADKAGLVVRNRFRSQSVRWSEVASVSFEKRRGPWWYPFIMIWGRWIGVIRLADGRVVEIEATESFWANWSGRMFSGSKADAERRTQALCNCWTRRRG